MEGLQALSKISIKMLSNKLWRGLPTFKRVFSNLRQGHYSDWLLNFRLQMGSVSHNEIDGYLKIEKITPTTLWLNFK